MIAYKIPACWRTPEQASLQDQKLFLSHPVVSVCSSPYLLATREIQQVENRAP